MRRKDREITDLQTIQEIIDAGKVCRVGVISEDVAYVSPMNYGYSKENGQFTFYFHGAAKGRKIDAIREGARVCIELDEIHEVLHMEGFGFTCKYRSVVAFGQPIIIEEVAKKKEALLRILAQYPEFDGLSFPDNMLAATTVYQVTVDEITAKGHV